MIATGEHELSPKDKNVPSPLEIEDIMSYLDMDGHIL
jgi:hypothetical protein